MGNQFVFFLLLFINAVAFAKHTMQSQKNYGGIGNVLATAIAKTTNSRYVIAGSSNSSFASVVNRGRDDWLLLGFDNCAILAPTVASSQNFVTCSNPKVSSLMAIGTNL